MPQSKTNALSYVAIAFQPVAFIGIFLEYIVLFSVYLFPDIAMSDVLFGLVFDIEAVHHSIFGVCVGGADRKTTHTLAIPIGVYRLPFAIDLLILNGFFLAFKCAYHVHFKWLDK